ncbi:unnamed protein product [Taenia asiatica]|uniref:Uncharacterized protein n=1 Tax=Taenia asiatica TaxID=60517 RepID=A0A3P6PV67_TAEAS|nr:unnamed protein product [Taenia asiatica]
MHCKAIPTCCGIVFFNLSASSLLSCKHFTETYSWSVNDQHRRCSFGSGPLTSLLQQHQQHRLYQHRRQQGEEMAHCQRFLQQQVKSSQWSVPPHGTTPTVQQLPTPVSQNYSGVYFAPHPLAPIASQSQAVLPPPPTGLSPSQVDAERGREKLREILARRIKERKMADAARQQQQQQRHSSDLGNLQSKPQCLSSPTSLSASQACAKREHESFRGMLERRVKARRLDHPPFPATSQSQAVLPPPPTGLSPSQVDAEREREKLRKILARRIKERRMADAARRQQQQQRHSSDLENRQLEPLLPSLISLLENQACADREREEIREIFASKVKERKLADTARQQLHQHHHPPIPGSLQSESLQLPPLTPFSALKSRVETEPQQPPETLTVEEEQQSLTAVIQPLKSKRHQQR